MKLSRLLTIGIFFFTLNSYAQITPQPSSTQTVTQDFGLGRINLTYSRPNAKGRKMLGGIEPFDKVWRTGANAATILKFSDDVMMEGHKVPAGEYGLFTIPGEKQWTIILSKNAKQWGAYSYKESEDFLRFTVTPSTTAQAAETFTIQFANVYPTSAEMQLMWQNTLVTVKLTCDIDAKIMARIDSAMNTAKKPYYDAVIYYWNNNKDMNKALEWAGELEKTPGMPPMVAKLWKARVLLKKGDKAAAAATAKEGVKLATDAKSDEYIRLNSEVVKAATK
ncbi:DUF2911 domain-containing protein [Mucilaginibacter xinganensis]|uniref:DUF2911 domain-containing protein n=1 Tax=Mucilaginibacter xinganensis TaxID=1234841 RepID=A0A223NUI9_9SPHI|nr:DUF2911 domain-containing protein [Mucilaginibacter xinganensis]ASU33420.1 hypothetical protein MuYL_1522 [Mucilaginibacter xinganensis]